MENQKQPQGAQIDPVCGMEVDPESAAGTSEYKGRVYLFCCEGCKEEFDSHPQQYVSG